MERTGIVTMKGGPMTLEGPELRAGDQAPDFTVLDRDLNPLTLEAFFGRIKVISVTPSLDTPVCDLQAHWFNDEAASLPGEVAILNMSMDLPFAIRRFCVAGGIDRVQVLSDHREASFGRGWGVLIKELRLLARAVFIVDGEDIVRYVQIVPEVTSAPDYESAMNVLKEII